MPYELSKGHLKEELFESKERYFGKIPDKEHQMDVARRVEAHAKEIEEFIKQIVEASSEDFVSIEVRNSEFYIKDYMNHISKTYSEKFMINMTDYKVEEYENRLLKGDFDRAVEVMENLLENALKYGDGKKISISFYEEDDERSLITIGLDRVD